MHNYIYLKFSNYIFLLFYLTMQNNFKLSDDLLSLDMSSFYDNSNIQITENDLKCNTYLYYINHMDNSNQPEIDFNEIANKGIHLMDTFFKTAAPIMKTVNEKINEFNTLNQTQHDNSNVVAKKIFFFKNETDSDIYYALDLPRIKKEDCKININGSVINISAVTEPPEVNFEFLPCNRCEVNLELPFSVNKSDITAKHSNGVLYISIKKSNNQNVHINILD
jgi:HSP20 family molecular chaperone IbpA